MSWPTPTTVFQPGGLALPALTVLDELAEFGLTVALSADDTSIYTALTVAPSGHHVFNRSLVRFNPDGNSGRVGTHTGALARNGQAVNLTTFLFVHDPDWRPGLAALRDTFQNYFYANASVNTTAFDGLMAYADYRGDEAAGGPTGNTSIPFEDLVAMGTAVNWDASFPFAGKG